MKLPVECVIGHKYIYPNKENVLDPQKVNLTAKYVPLKWIFKKLSEVSETFDTLVSHMSTLYNESSIVSNFVQDSLWKNIRENSNNKFYIPNFLFQDDCEAGNELGSHAE